MKKDYTPFVGLEDDFQQNVATYLDYKGLFWHHVANERKTSKWAGAKLKRKGVKRGVVDCSILEPRGKYHGLYIELKVKGGKVSPDQKGFILNATNRGYKAVVCWSLDEVVDLVEEYLKLKRPPKE